MSRYKRAEPDFQLKWLNSSNEKISAINIELIRYIEITKSQATELMAKIVERFPLSKDFGSNEPSERQSEIPVFGNLRMKEIFVPATAEEIAKYRDEYPKWLQCCEDIIRNYHKTQQQHAVAPSFTFQATNTGTRPAKHVLVTFFTKGDFSILPPTSGDKKKSKKGALTFPDPPTPPAGHWQNAGARFQNLNLLLAAMARRFVDEFSAVPPLRPYLGDYKRNPNKFYYLRSPPIPQSEFSLECEQWRHGVKPELFFGEIHADLTKDEINGALECRVHAENASQVNTAQIPIRIKIREISAYDLAKNRIEYLLAGMNKLISDEA